jgi:hypothetical protein
MLERLAAVLEAEPKAPLLIVGHGVFPSPIGLE